ncbi:threonine synthase [Phlyctochytrium bullatum]|nr:threonine synthase [Phlyctochytrium bullatum]
MPYRSTRNSDSDEDAKLLTFEEAVIEGLAPDGGLYIPTHIPRFEIEQILSWKDLPYHELALHLFRPFVETPDESQLHGISDEDLKDILRRSFATFSHPEVTPVLGLPIVPAANGQPSPATSGKFHVMELFHGPTFAFKDVALQVLGNLFEFFLVRRNSRLKPGEALARINVLGATSGDTGGAAIYGLRGKKNVNVFILHPKHRISPVQEQQMTSVLDPNVYNVALDGSTFDDCQETVKVLFGEADFKKQYKLGAINSINWARILAQTTYYFASFLQLCRKHTTESGAVGATKSDLPHVQYSVPTGNFGDILAGYYAARMGLPVERLIVATNENDILHRFWETGSYSKPPSTGSSTSDVKMTLSPAMDILVSSNFERLLWYLTRGDSIKGAEPNYSASAASSSQIVSWMKDLREKGGFSVPSNVHSLSKEIFVSRRVSDDQTSDCIRRYYCREEATADIPRYVLDPHTAVGVVAAEDVLSELAGEAKKGLHTIVLATASPGKFPDAVLKAVKGQDKTSKADLVYEDFAPLPLIEQAGLPKRCTDIVTKGDRDLALKFVRKVVVETVGNI